uniref:Non-specific lipid-transfer protein n=1 Tax=Cuphea paucipetala TaxID=857164 RepID=A0A0U1WTV7_9MYRT|nr:non-specific lipid transfer protein 2 [Cuphea paucipetala]
MAFTCAIPKLVCIALIGLIVVFPGRVESSVSCTQVVNYLTPCVNFVINGGSVSQQCCSGIRSLNTAASNTKDRQDVCNCIKSVVNGVPVSQTYINNAANLPSKCGVRLPYKISPSTDCKSVK